MASCDLLHCGQRLMLLRLCFTYLTLPNPTSAVRGSGAAHLLSRSLSIVPRSTESMSRANGIAIDGRGGRSEVGPWLARARTLRPSHDLPGEAWNEAWTGPLMVCAWKPLFALPNETAEAIMIDAVQHCDVHQYECLRWSVGRSQPGRFGWAAAGCLGGPSLVQPPRGCFASIVDV